MVALKITGKLTMSMLIKLTYGDCDDEKRAGQSANCNVDTVQVVQVNGNRDVQIGVRILDRLKRV